MTKLFRRLDVSALAKSSAGPRAATCVRYPADLATAAPERPTTLRHKYFSINKVIELAFCRLVKSVLLR